MEKQINHIMNQARQTHYFQFFICIYKKPLITETTILNDYHPRRTHKLTACNCMIFKALIASMM